MRSGPTEEHLLFGKTRRIIAVTASLSLLTLGFSIPPNPSTAAAPDPGVAASSSGASFEVPSALDEVRGLQLDAQRAARGARQAAQAATAVKVEAARAAAVQAATQAKKKTEGAKKAVAGKSTAGTRPATSAAAGAGKKAPAAAPAASGRVAEVTRFALAQVGKRYVFATAGPNTFDCSGLTKASFARIGITLTHQTNAQFRTGRAVSRSQLQPGDLVFWGSGGNITHVAISLGGNAIVHAANSRTGVVRGTIYGNPVGYRRIVG